MKYIYVSTFAKSRSTSFFSSSLPFHHGQTSQELLKIIDYRPLSAIESEHWFSCSLFHVLWICIVSLVIFYPSPIFLASIRHAAHLDERPASR
jgi:hypothetical protein